MRAIHAALASAPAASRRQGLFRARASVRSLRAEADHESNPFPPDRRSRGDALRGRAARARPAPGEVRIRHTAVALNFRDILVRRGQHAVTSLPSGLGTESAGVIEAVGPGVTEFTAGDRVADGLPARLRLCRGAQRAGRARRQAAGRHRRAHRGLDDGARHDRALPAARHLQGEARRHHRDPCRGRRRRPDRQPMGEASRRHRDRHRRQRRQGRGRPRPRLRPRAALRRFRASRCARSPAARACRWSTTRSAASPSRARCKCLRAARHPRLVRRILGRSAAGLGARARPHGLAVRHPSEPDRLHARRAPNCWRPRTTCSPWSAAARSGSRSITAIRCARPRRRTATSRRARPPDRWC